MIKTFGNWCVVAQGTRLLHLISASQRSPSYGCDLWPLGVAPKQLRRPLWGLHNSLTMSHCIIMHKTPRKVWILLKPGGIVKKAQFLIWYTETKSGGERPFHITRTRKRLFFRKYSPVWLGQWTWVTLAKLVGVTCCGFCDALEQSRKWLPPDMKIWNTIFFPKTGWDC